MKRRLESNIWKYSVLLAAQKRTYMTIFGIYILTTVPDATVRTLGAILAVASFAKVIFELPSGYLSDRMGHKNALVLGQTLMFVSTFLYLVGGRVVVFVIGGVLMSIGAAFTSGSDTAFMHETLKGLGRDREYSHVMGRAASIGSAIPIVLIVLIPFLVSIDFRLPFVVAVVVDVIGLFAALSFVTPKTKKVTVKEMGIKNFSYILKTGRELGFLRYAIFLGVAAGIVNGGASFRDVYQAALGIPVIYYGVFWGLARVIVTIGLTQNGKIKRFYTLHQFLRFKLLGMLLLFGLLVTANPFVIVAVFILLSAFNWAFKQVEQHHMLDIIGESSHKATLLSMKTLIYSLSNGFTSMIVGAAAALAGYPIGFFGVAIFIVIVMTPLYYYAVSRKIKS